MPGLRQRPPVGCLNRCGNMAERSALLTAGLNGRRKAIRSSPTLFARMTVNLYSWRRSIPFERGDEAEGFLIVTAAADKGLVDIHDRRPMVLTPEAARAWMSPDIGGKEAEEIVVDGTVPAGAFTWRVVSRTVGNVKNQGPELIARICSHCWAIII